MSRCTIIAIAERVGVSPATVSRALNQLPGVSEDKRRQILGVAAELDYHPNAIARCLQGQRTNTIAFVAEVDNRPSADLFFFKDFITALALRCACRGLDLLIHPAQGGESGLRQVSQLLRSCRADGLIIADARHDDPRLRYLLEHRLRFALFGRSDVAGSYPYVDVDGAAGIAMATAHLIGRGHRRIAFLGLPAQLYCASDRLAGYLRALAAAGIAADPAYLAHGVQTELEMRQVVERLLALPTPPTAFVAASDMLALYAMGAASQHGLRVGRDVAITGFDDLPLTAHTDPPLTTLRQPYEAVCDALIGLLEPTGGPERPRQVLLQPELVVRESSGASA